MTTLIATRNSPGSTIHVERALTALALAGDNAVRASATIGIPDRTLRDWRQKYRDRYDEIRLELAPQIEQQIVQEARAFAITAGQAERELLQATLEATRNGTIKDPASALRNITTSKALQIDKVLQLEGRPTKTTLHLTSEDVLNSLQHRGYINGTAEEE